jgi:hypothetical protein
MISKEYGGAKRTIWSLFGTQFGEEFGEVFLLRLNSGRTAFGAPDPTASGNLVVDRTVIGLAMNLRSSEDLSCHRIEDANWRFSGFGFGAGDCVERQTHNLPTNRMVLAIMDGEGT